MKSSGMWSNQRFYGSHLHHIFGGAYRNKSEKDGLVIFLTPEMHNMSNEGIHFNKAFNEFVKREAQLTWMEYYGKTKEDFLERYGHNYVE